MKEGPEAARVDRPLTRSGIAITFVDAYFYTVLAFFAVSNVYYSYRYIFKYNATETSPTYSATPPAFQIPKYILAGLLICLGAFLLGLSRPGKVHRSAGLIGSACVYFMLSASINGDLSSASFLKMFYLNVPLLLPLVFLALKPSHISALEKCVGWLFAYHMAYSAIQLGLFFSIGRLPALAYADSIMVRFGGGLDDPNAFAPMVFCLCLYLFDWMVLKGAAPGRVLALVFASILYLFTLSFTSFLSAPVMLAGYALMRKEARRFLAVAALVASAVLVVLAATTPLLDLVTLLIKMKQGSVDDHFSWGIEDFVEYPPLNWAFGSLGQFEGRFTESDLVYLFFRYGMIGLFFLAAIAVAAARNFHRVLAAAPVGPKSSFLVCAIVYLVSFVLGTWNLPYFHVHPINLNFWFLALLALTQRRGLIGWATDGTGKT